jgi:hypothetical protein
MIQRLDPTPELVESRPPDQAPGATHDRNIM